MVQVRLAFRSLTDEDLPAVITNTTENNIDSEEEQRLFSFDEFCCLLSEFRYRVSKDIDFVKHI